MSRRSSFTRATIAGSALQRSSASSFVTAIERGAIDDDGARDVGERQRPAAGARDVVGGRDVGGLADGVADAGGERLGTRADLGLRRGEHAQRGDLAQRALLVEVGVERRLERGERHLVEAQRARHRVLLEAVDDVGAAEQQPRLRPAEQLVARRGHHRGARRDRRADRGLVGDAELREVDEHAGALVLHDRHAVHGAEVDEVGERDLVGEADDAVVARVHLEHQPGVCGQRALVVREVRLVRRADLDHPGAGLGHDVGDAERAADLDELPAGDDRLAAARERRDAEHDGGGVVVDRHRGLGAGEPAQQRLDVDVAAAALPALDVVLERRVAARDLGDRGGGRLGEHAAAEVGVHDDAGGVDDAAQRRPRGERRAGDRVARDRLGGGLERLAGEQPWRARPRSSRARRRRRARAGPSASVSASAGCASTSSVLGSVLSSAFVSMRR